jgi:hypothetical protein
MAQAPRSFLALWETSERTALRSRPQGAETRETFFQVTDRSWRPNPARLEGGHIAQQAPTYTILRALAVMAVTLRSGKRQSTAICGRVASARTFSPFM